MFKNLFYLLAVFFCTSQILTAQNKITGNVKDKDTHDNLQDVSIYLHSNNTLALTDSNGYYALKNIKSGEYTIEIAAMGYVKQIRTINLSTDIVLNIELQESIKEYNDVVVTGVSRFTEIKASPIILKSVHCTDLQQSSSINLIDAIKNVPGINTITTGAAIAKPTIRGLGYNRVLTLYNGIKQEGQQWGDEHGIEIDEYSIEKVEIIKGPGSLLYGSDAIAGVLHFISNKPAAIGKINTQIISNYQSNNNLVAHSISNTGNRNNWQWAARFTAKIAGNYQNKYDGKIYNSGFREYNGSALIGTTRNWGYSQIRVTSFNTDINLVEGDRDSTGNFIYQSAINATTSEEKTVTNKQLKGYSIGIPYQIINHLQVASNSSFLLKKGTLKVDIAYQNNKRKEFGDVLLPTSKSLYFDLYTVNYNIVYNLPRQSGWETSLGGSGMYQNNGNKGIEFLIPAYQSVEGGVFVHVQKALDKKWNFAAGIRIDNKSISGKKLVLDSLDTPVIDETASTTLKFNSFHRNYSSIVGSIGVSYQCNKESTFKWNIARGFRTPNISEIASNGRHEGTFRYEYGQLALKPELSHQIDLAYFYNSDHLTIECTPFVNFISNFIYSKKLLAASGGDSIPDILDPAPAFEFTQGNTILLGSELYVDLHPHPLDWLHIGNAFSFVQATQTNQPDSTRYLPFIPAPKYRTEWKAEFKKLGKNFNNGYIKVSFDYYFAQNRYFKAYTTETNTPAYSLLSIGMGVNVKQRNNKLLTLIFNIDNITNTAYQSHLSRLKYAPTNANTGRTGVFNMGRNANIKIIWNL